MKWLIVFLTVSVVSASSRPLSFFVKHLETKFECSVNYPIEIANRKSNMSAVVSLDEGLSSLFKRESYSVVTKDGNKIVNVLSKSISKLGDLGKSKISPKKLMIDGIDTMVESHTMLLSFDKEIDRSSKISILDRYGLTYDANSLENKLIVVKTKVTTSKELLAKISATEGVKANFNYMVKTANAATVGVNLAQVVISDQFYSQQWGHQQVGGHVGYLDQKSKLVKIVVLDTGVNTSHEDLSGGRISNRDFNDTLVIDNDLDGHGTGVTGVIGARWNGVGISGLSGAEVVSIKVFDH